MPYKLKWIGNDVITEFYDKLTVDDVIKANQEVYGDQRLDAMRFQIANFSTISSYNVNELDVKIVSTLDIKASIWNRNVKIASVTKDPVIFELINIYNNMLEETNWRCQTFETFDAAFNWCTNRNQPAS